MCARFTNDCLWLLQWLYVAVENSCACHLAELQVPLKRGKHTSDSPHLPCYTILALPFHSWLDIVGYWNSEDPECLSGGDAW